MEKLKLILAKSTIATLFCLIVLSSRSPAAGSPGQDMVESPVRQAGSLPAGEMVRNVADQRAEFSLTPAKQHELELRLAEQTINDLNHSLAIAAADIESLGKLVDSITLLEPPKREYDIRNLQEWYYRYSDRIRDMLAEFRDQLESLREFPPAEGRLGSLYSGLVQTNSESLRDLQVMVDKLDAELERLFRIIDRRQFLNDRLLLLQEQLSAIEEKIRDRQARPTERTRDEVRAERLRSQIRIVQTELISLYDIREELLKHYVVMLEMGREEAFWLELKSDEYELLGITADIMEQVDSKSAPELEDAYRRLIRSFESEIRRVNRKIEELDRRRSRVTPAGTFRDLDRSRELSDFYLDRQQRYSNYISRLKARVGSFEAGLSEILSGRDR